MRPVIIYALIDPRSGVARYVGLTRNLNARMSSHRRAKSVNRHLNHWIESLRIAGNEFGVRVLEIVPEDISGDVEKRWIKRFRDDGLSLVNLTDGGEGNYSFSAEVRKKQSENKKEYYCRPDCIPSHFRALNKSRIGIPLSPEHKEKVSKALKGKTQVHSAEDRAASGNRMRERWKDPAYREKMLPICQETARKTHAIISERGNPRKGTKLTEEHRKKVSEGVRRAQTPEYLAKMSAIMKVKSKQPEMTPERRAKIAASLRAYNARRKSQPELVR